MFVAVLVGPQAGRSQQSSDVGFRAYLACSYHGLGGGIGLLRLDGPKDVGSETR